MIAETTQDGATIAEYIFLNNDPLVKKSGNSIYYYHNDHIGTPQRMTDNDKAIVWAGEYQPFGEPLSISGAITSNLRLPGQYYDAETELSSNYFRDYNSMIGRYVQADPLGIRQGGNHLYIYVGNNPVEGIDYYGLWRTGKPRLIWDPPVYSPPGGAPPPDKISCDWKSGGELVTTQGKCIKVEKETTYYTQVWLWCCCPDPNNNLCKDRKKQKCFDYLIDGYKNATPRLDDAPNDPHLPRIGLPGR